MPLRLRAKTRQRQRREEVGLLSRRDDLRRRRQLRRDTRRQFAPCDADREGSQIPSAHASPTSPAPPRSRSDDPSPPCRRAPPFASVFDPRGECFGDFEQRFLRGALAFGVAAAGDEFRHDRARLRQRQSGTDAFRARATCRGDDMRVVAIAFDDPDRFVEQIGLLRSRAASRKSGTNRHRILMTVLSFRAPRARGIPPSERVCVSAGLAVVAARNDTCVAHVNVRTASCPGRMWRCFCKLTLINVAASTRGC